MNDAPRRLALALATLALAATGPAAAETLETKKVKVTVEVLARGLEHPWSVEPLADGAALVSERPGRLRVFRNGALSEPVEGLPELYVGGQGGLLDLAPDPGFAENRTLFFTASVPGEGGQGTAVFRARLSADETRLEDVTRIFAMNRFTGTEQHFGSRIAFAADGTLFFGIGDRGEMERAQDPMDHAGSILHITRDGKPASPGAIARGAPEIFSIGHRNPQGLTIDPADNRLVTVEHGARGGDEINRPEAGRNYGWPEISFGKHYSGAEIGRGTAAEGFEQPVYYWDPSIAPGAIEVYRGAMFPEWEGNLLVAALKYQLVARLERDQDGKVTAEERLLDNLHGRLRDIRTAADGSLLIVTDEADGALIRLSRAE